MIIPPNKLSADALAGLIEEYVTRDGTNLAEMGSKADMIRRAVESKRLLVVFDEQSESVNLMTPEDYQKAELAAEQAAEQGDDVTYCEDYSEAEQEWVDQRYDDDEC
ncbi:YheU family protein [Planctomycetota bacterium]|nr:YheU family protein [Planctomycetota bacterium]